VQFGIRPEHFEAVEGIEIPVTADVVEQLGSTSYLYGTIATGEAIVAQSSQGRRRPGDRVALRFNPMDARLFDQDGTRIR
jgi:lactose/L-arabinose transport system ATP-binding protein